MSHSNSYQVDKRLTQTILQSPKDHFFEYLKGLLNSLYNTMLPMASNAENQTQKFTTIAISCDNYATLKKLGGTGDSFNTVITRILKASDLQKVKDAVEHTS